MPSEVRKADCISIGVGMQGRSVWIGSLLDCVRYSGTVYPMEVLPAMELDFADRHMIGLLTS